MLVSDDGQFTLRVILEKYPECRREAAKLDSYLGDLLPCKEWQRRLLVTALRRGIVKAAGDEQELKRLHLALVDDDGFDKDKAWWAIQEWCEALQVPFPAALASGPASSAAPSAGSAHSGGSGRPPKQKRRKGPAQPSAPSPPPAAPAPMPAGAVPSPSPGVGAPPHGDSSQQGLGSKLADIAMGIGALILVVAIIFFDICILTYTLPKLFAHLPDILSYYSINLTENDDMIVLKMGSATLVVLLTIMLQLIGIHNATRKERWWEFHSSYERDVENAPKTFAIGAVMSVICVAITAYFDGKLSF